MVSLVPLVHRLARTMRRHLPAQVELDDLVGAGCLGLVDAVRKFDRTKGIRIESYAQHRIGGAMLDSLRSLDGASRDLRRKMKRVERTRCALESQLQRPASDAEMARSMGLGLEGWYKTAQEVAASGGDRGRLALSKLAERPLEEILVAENQETPWEACYRQEQREIVNRALACLPQRQQTVLSLYHKERRSMAEIAARLGVHESRVSQLHSAAILRLRSIVEGMLRPRRPPCPVLCRATQVVFNP